MQKIISLFTGVYAVGLLLFLALRLLFGDSFWWLAFFGNFTPFYFVGLIGLLPLAIIFRARRGALLMLPLLLIGIVWFGRLYMPKPQTDAAGEPTLRVVAFNVWGDNRNLEAVENWLRDQRADVAVTIELPRAWADGIPALSDLYPEQRRIPDNGLYWGGTMLSRHRIISTESFYLAEIPQQRIVIEFTGKQMAIYGIHLYLPVGRESHIDVPVNYYTATLVRYDDDARDAQIHTLLERLNNEPLPYIVAGDFNMSDQSSAYNDLAAVMGDSFREAGTGLGASWPMLKAVLGLPEIFPPLVRIDYIWHSDHFRTISAEQGPNLGSDHLPLVAALALDE